MKFIATGDNHWCKQSRWSECVRVHGWIAELVESRKPDVFLGAGDMYERASTPEERDAVAAWLMRIAEVCPIVLVKGNHDRDLDCALLARLKARHPIYVEEAASVRYVAGAAIACMAWPERARLLAMTGSSAAADLVAQEALQNVLRGLGQELAAWSGPRILLGHFMADGAVTSVGQPLVGQSMNVGLSDLALAQADITIMGHVHAPQQWVVDGAPIAYCGSPYRTSYGEVETKSVLAAEFGDEGRLDFWERVPTPCAPMMLVEAEWTGEIFEGAGFDEAEAAGGEVRFRYSVPADQRDAARAAAADLRAVFEDAGAVDVKIEERVVTSNAARAPEVAEARTLPDKLRALWSARGTTPDAERAERLVGKASDLERRQHEI